MTMATKTTTKKPVRRRKPKAVEPEVAEVVAPEVVEQPLEPTPEPAPKPEPEQPPDSTIKRVYLNTHAGVQVYENQQAWPLIREIQAVAGDDDTPFIFYEDGMPVYVALRASEVRPLVFPEPGSAADQYGLTSVELYGLTVTFPNTIARIIELETRAKGGLMNEAKKIMTLALPIVAAVFAIFIMAVLLGG